MKNTFFLVLILLMLAGGVFFASQNKKIAVLPAVNEMPVEEIFVEEMPAEEMPTETMASYIDISPQAAKELIAQTPDLVIIDVSPKYDEGHLPGAINYYVSDGSLDEAIPSLDPTVTYLVYCHTDSASIAGAEKLIAAGLKKVYRLEGNYAAWIEADYELEK